MVWGSLYVFGFVVCLALCTEWHYIPSRSSAVWSFSSLPFLYEESYEPEPTAMECMVDITNALGVAILQDNSYSRGNFAFSPYGVASVLVVLYEGAGGDSATQIRKAVGFPRDKDILRVGFKDINRHLKSYFSHEGFLSGLTMNKETSTLNSKFKIILKFYDYDVDFLMFDSEKKQEKNTTMPDHAYTTASASTESGTSKTENPITTDAMQPFTVNPEHVTTETSQTVPTTSEISLTSLSDMMAKTEMSTQEASTVEMESEGNVMLTTSTTSYPETAETTTIFPTTAIMTNQNATEYNESVILNEERPMHGEVVEANENQSQTASSTQIDYKTTSEMPEIQTQTQESMTSNKPNEEDANIDNGMLIPPSVYFEPTTDGFLTITTTTEIEKQEPGSTTQTTSENETTASGTPTIAHYTTWTTHTTEYFKTTFGFTDKTEGTATSETFSIPTTGKMETTTELAANFESNDDDKSDTAIPTENLEKTTLTSFENQSETSDSYSTPSTVENLIKTTPEYLPEEASTTLLIDMIPTTSGTTTETSSSTISNISTLENLISTSIPTSERNPDKTSQPTESSTMSTGPITSDSVPATNTETFTTTKKMITDTLTTKEAHATTTTEENTIIPVETSTATEVTVTASSLSTPKESSLSTTTESNLSTTTENSLSTTAESSLSTTTESSLSTTTESSLSTTTESNLSTTTESSLSTMTENSLSTTTESSLSTTTESSLHTTTEVSTFLPTQSPTTETTIAISTSTTEQENLTTAEKLLTNTMSTTKVDKIEVTNSLPTTTGEIPHVSGTIVSTTEQSHTETMSTSDATTVTTEFFQTDMTSTATEISIETSTVETPDNFSSTTLSTNEIKNVVKVAELQNLRGLSTNTSKRERRESMNNRLNRLEISTKTIISGSLNLTENISKNFSGSLRPKRTITDYLGSHVRPDINLQVQNSMYDTFFSNFESYENLPRLLFLVDGVVDMPVPMMINTNIFPYGYIPRLHCKALEFPLDDHRYKLLILLPLERRGLRQLLQDLGSCPLREVIKTVRPARVRTAIPSFMIDGLVVLTSTLQRLGIWDVFDPKKSNLSGMSTDSELYVENVEQSVTVVIRNYVEILEIHEGPEDTRQVIYDFEATHPFLYFVYDTATNVALMAGQMLDPLNSRIY